MTDTKVATGTEVHSKPARLARMTLFLRMMFISRLKGKTETKLKTKLLENTDKDRHNIYWVFKSSFELLRYTIVAKKTSAISY